MTVSWYKDGELLSHFHDLTSRAVLGVNGQSLLISPTLMSDLGFYQCRVKNNVGEEEKVEAFLNVQCE